MRNKIAKGLAMAALSLFLLHPAFAQNAPKISGGSQIRLFDAWAQFPYPSWHKTENALKESRLSRHQQADTFVLAMVPKSETFQKWTKQYTLVGHWNENLTLSKFISSSIHTFSKPCGVENVSVRKIIRQPDSGLVVVFCTNSPNGPKQYGYGEGVGEVVILWMGKHKNTFVKIYQYWRGNKFNVADASTWPVTTQRLDRSVLEFTGIKLLPYTP
ncbi:MAG: hypothetical protein HKN05_01425 [Rhizobiales bacterium]|nr:hypothetical protein [Hyphomicrobiales bacterium]